jgi:octaprenyl-diphosphate synthase
MLATLLSKSSAPPDAVRNIIEPDMRAVDEVIRQRLYSDVVLIRQVAEYIIGSGGKRLRPALVVLAARACGYQGTHHHLLAAIVEFIHTATLLHDDVVDESSLRRGKETANQLFGNAASVLVGDFLYSRAFQMMVEVGSMRVMQVLADATNTIAEGEVLQLLNSHDPEIDEASYLRVIRYKTAQLFEAAARLGAILGGVSPESEAAMASYGLHLGMAFQLVDDALDYSGDPQVIGKNLGDDLAEGKVTLPLLHVLRQGGSDDARSVRAALEDPNRNTLAAVLPAIQNAGGLEYTRLRARAEAAKAAAAIQGLPRSNYRDCLLELTEFAVQRDH